MQQVGLSRLEELSINTIRTLAMDGVQKANSGHPGTPMGVATMAYALWTDVLRYNPRDPRWPNRDRFVLSAGHASMLLYSMLYLTGYDLTLDDLKNFRQWGSRTPGHPEYGLHARRRDDHRPARPGRRQRRRHGPRRALPGRALQSARTSTSSTTTSTCIASDGDMMEGVGLEAASLAGAPEARQADPVLRRQPHHHRGRHATSPSPRTSASASRPTAGTCSTCRRQRPGRKSRRARGRPSRRLDAPSLIVVPHRHRLRRAEQGRTPPTAHGEPLGDDEVKLTKENLGWPPDADVLRAGRGARRLPRRRGTRHAGAGRVAGARSTSAAAKYPDQAAEFDALMRGAPARGLGRRPAYLPAGAIGRWPRAAAPGKVLNAIAATAADPHRRLRRPVAVDRHADLEGRATTSAIDKLQRPQHALRRARARHGRRGQRHDAHAACAPTAARSSSSPTTCARRCASPR